MCFQMVNEKYYLCYRLDILSKYTVLNKNCSKWIAKEPSNKLMKMLDVVKALAMIFLPNITTLFDLSTIFFIHHNSSFSVSSVCCLMLPFTFSSFSFFTFLAFFFSSCLRCLSSRAFCGQYPDKTCSAALKPMTYQ